MDSITDIMGVARRAETAEISRGAQSSAKVAEVQHPTDEVFKIEAPAAPVAAVAKPKSKGKGKGGKGKGKGGAGGASGTNGPAPTGIHQCFVCDGAHFQAKCPEVLSGRKQQKTFEAYATQWGKLPFLRQIKSSPFFTKCSRFHMVKILPPSNFFFSEGIFFYVYNLFTATYGGLKNQIFKKYF
jgi:hypothetical protein